MTTRLTPVNPPTLFTSPAFAQGMIAAAGPTLYVGGQNGITSDGTMLDGLEAQTAQAMRNVLAVLDAAGAGPGDVAKLTIYLDPGVDPGAAFAATRAVWGDHPTAVSVIAVKPARPDALVEVEAVAAVPTN